MLVSCQNHERTYVLNEDLELKKDFYFKLQQLVKDEDSTFSFNQLEALEENVYDSIVIYPSYTSVETINSMLNNVEITALIDKKYIPENNSVIIFTEKGTPKFYLNIDSMFSFSDSRNYHYSKNCIFKIRPYRKDSLELGAYLIAN